MVDMDIMDFDSFSDFMLYVRDINLDLDSLQFHSYDFCDMFIDSVNHIIYINHNTDYD